MIPKVLANLDGRVAFRPARSTDEWCVVTERPGMAPAVAWVDERDLDGDEWWPMRPEPRHRIPERLRDDFIYDPRIED